MSLVLPAGSLCIRGDPDHCSGRQQPGRECARYTQPGGRITVTLEARGDEAVLAVSDNGIGIAAENLERIFEPFMQSHQPLINPSSGLGIGLASCADSWNCMVVG